MKSAFIFRKVPHRRTSDARVSISSVIFPAATVTCTVRSKVSSIQGRPKPFGDP